MEYAFYLIGGGLILLSSAEMIYISNRNERLSLFSSLFPKTLAIMILAILLVRKEVGIVSIALVFLMVGISYFLLRAFMWIRKGGFLGIDFTGWGYLVRKALPFFPFLLFAILYSRIGIIALAFMEGFKACGFFVPLFSMVGIVSLPLITPLGRFLPLIYSNNKGEAFIKKHVRNLKTIFYVYLLSRPFLLSGQRRSFLICLAKNSKRQFSLSRLSSGVWVLSILISHFIA